LPRVGDVNVRNRHGMTALMRAAYYGHEPIVRLLLERGADPNLKRHDKFTPLALAAFFGHAETVKTLIEFGAKPEIVTRCGASARTWASARTFVEVARTLETAPVVARPIATRTDVAPEPMVSSAASVNTAPVKTLKDPPEIWDLVQEVPRSFNPRSAFISRIASARLSFAVGAVAVLLLMVAGGVGAFVLRRSHARNMPAVVAAPPPRAVETAVSEPAPAPPSVTETPIEVVNDNHARVVSNKARMLIRQPRAAAFVNEEQVETAQTREAPPPVAAPQFDSPKPIQPPAKTTPAPLSPNVITPSKNAPAKAKVIQWP
jgi:hypothetical protein